MTRGVLAGDFVRRLHLWYFNQIFRILIQSRFQSLQHKPNRQIEKGRCGSNEADNFNYGHRDRLRNQQPVVWLRPFGSHAWYQVRFKL